MPMAGTPAEYERMALKSIEKAAEDVSDTMYHLTRAEIFAALATAAATERASGPDRTPPPTPARGVAPPDPDGHGADSGHGTPPENPSLPAVRVS